MLDNIITISKDYFNAAFKVNNSSGLDFLYKMVRRLHVYIKTCEKYECVRMLDLESKSSLEVRNELNFFNTDQNEEYFLDCYFNDYVGAGDDCELIKKMLDFYGIKYTNVGVCYPQSSARCITVKIIRHAGRELLETI